MLTDAFLKNGLITQIIGKKKFYYPSLPSTMDMAHREARKGIAEGTVIATGEQTAGRGRLNRTWYTPCGNIAFSVILRPDISQLKYIVMIAALAVSQALEKNTALKPAIKWPNDVLINGKKMAGILIENELRGQKVDYCNVGIGINIGSYPEELASIATSINNELSCPVRVEDVLAWVLTEFDNLYSNLRQGNSPLDGWRSRLETLGKPITVKMGDKIINGLAETIDADGSLILRLEDGSTTTIVAGDVTLIRQ